MSIATALTALANDVDAAKAAITAKGGTAPSGTSDMADAIAAIPSGGITPTGNINITDTNVTDVTNYATATIVDADLIASNIKKDVNILGVVGSFEGGGSLPLSISKIDGGSFTPASDTKCSTYRIAHNLGVIPQFMLIWCDDFSTVTTYPVDRLIDYKGRFFDYTNDGSSIRIGTWQELYRNKTGTAYPNASYFSYSKEQFGTTTDFCNYNTDRYYAAGTTYYWAVFA